MAGIELSIYDEPKIDCHNHVFDPARFPYAAAATTCRPVRKWAHLTS
jgi:hypothetical protein